MLSYSEMEQREWSPQRGVSVQGGRRKPGECGAMETKKIKGFFLFVLVLLVFFFFSVLFFFKEGVDSSSDDKMKTKTDHCLWKHETHY